LGEYVRTTNKFYSVDRKSICYIKHIFEAYDGLAVVETVDREASIIKLHIAPGCERDADNLILELKKAVIIETVEKPVNN